jgi:YtkA-like
MRAFVRLSLAVLAITLATGCMLFAKPPRDLDYSRTRMSAGGHYRGTIRPQGDSIPKGKLHSWTLHIESPDGSPVRVEQVAVNGGMPQHGHGLPTKPRATRRTPEGDVIVDGMKFNMGGWWVVTFKVTCAGEAPDSLTFNLKL